MCFQVHAAASSSVRTSSVGCFAMQPASSPKPTLTQWCAIANLLPAQLVLARRFHRYEEDRKWYTFAGIISIRNIPRSVFVWKSCSVFGRINPSRFSESLTSNKEKHQDLFLQEKEFSKTQHGLGQCSWNSGLALKDSGFDYWAGHLLTTWKLEYREGNIHLTQLKPPDYYTFGTERELPTARESQGK